MKKLLLASMMLALTAVPTAMADSADPIFTAAPAAVAPAPSVKGKKICLYQGSRKVAEATFKGNQSYVYDKKTTGERWSIGYTWRQKGSTITIYRNGRYDSKHTLNFSGRSGWYGGTRGGFC